MTSLVHRLRFKSSPCARKGGFGAGLRFWPAILLLIALIALYLLARISGAEVIFFLAATVILAGALGDSARIVPEIAAVVAAAMAAGVSGEGAGHHLGRTLVSQRLLDRDGVERIDPRHHQQLHVLAFFLGKLHHVAEEFFLVCAEDLAIG